MIFSKESEAHILQFILNVYGAGNKDFEPNVMNALDGATPNIIFLCPRILKKRETTNEEKTLRQCFLTDSEGETKLIVGSLWHVWGRKQTRHKLENRMANATRLSLCW